VIFVPIRRESGVESDIRIRCPLTVMEKRKAEAFLDSDSEIEVISGPSQPKRRNVAGSTFTQTHLLPSSTLSSPSESSHLPTFEFSELLSSLCPSPFPFFSPLSTSSTSTPSLSPTCTSWPIGCYDVDMMNGFARVDDLMKRKPAEDRSRRVLMEHIKTVFGVTIPYTTYCDQRTKWRRAPQIYETR
jgi:hypothetical protein